MKLSFVGSFFIVLASLFFAFQNCAQAPQAAAPIMQHSSQLALKSTAAAFNPQSHWQLISIEKSASDLSSQEANFDISRHQLNLRLSEIFETEQNCLGDCGQKYQVALTSTCLSAEGLLTNRWIEWEQAEVTQIQITMANEDQSCAHLADQKNLVQILNNTESLKVMGNTADEYLYLFAADTIFTFIKDQ